MTEGLSNSFAAKTIPQSFAFGKIQPPLGKGAFFMFRFVFTIIFRSDIINKEGYRPAFFERNLLWAVLLKS